MKYIIDGNKFESVKEICKFYDIKENTFYQRRRRGFTIEECIFGRKPKVKSRSCKCTDYNGMQFNSIREMCEYHNVPYGIYMNRKHRGHTLKECLDSSNIKQHTFIYKGEVRNSLKKLCKELDISYDTVLHYRKTKNLTIEEAVDICLENTLLRKRHRESKMNRKCQSEDFYEAHK